MTAMGHITIVKLKPNAAKLSSQNSRFSQKAPLNPTWVAKAKGVRMKARMIRKRSPTVLKG
jgi:hypothetical protein